MRRRTVQSCNTTPNTMHYPYPSRHSTSHYLVPTALHSYLVSIFFFFSSRRRHTRSLCDWSSDVCSSDLATAQARGINLGRMVSTLSPQARKITGTLDADLRLATAAGRDPKAALTGTGAFAVRNGSFPGLDLKSSLAQMARALQLNVPAGDTRFRYFGGDLRIARQRVESHSLRLQGDDPDGTAGGSLGFDKTLDYTGVAVLKALAAGASASAGALPSVSQLFGKMVPGAAGATGAQVPFSLRGTLDDPKFSLAGTPQFIRSQTTQPPPDQPQPPSLQDLFKPFH